MSVKEFDWLFVQMDMFLPQSTEGKGAPLFWVYLNLQYNINENIHFSVTITLTLHYLLLNCGRKYQLIETLK